MEEKREHFTMIRCFHLADLFTMANGFCGVAAIFLAMKSVGSQQPSHLFYAGLLIPVAIVFDFLDGRIARWRHQASGMGREMDSLADVVSFGVAPAAIAYAAGLNGAIDQAILLFFAGCGLSRLARYNVTAVQLSDDTGKVRYFEGTPITFSILPLGLLLIAYHSSQLLPAGVWGFRFHGVSVLFFISGCLMISKTVRIPKP